MKKNLGSFDKTLRLSAAIVVALLYYTKVISGTTALILGVLAVVSVITSFFSFCPLYLPFGFNTHKTKK